jgi:mannose-6-phosphate isomerase-like protein (cupin superfamily)
MLKSIRRAACALLFTAAAASCVAAQTADKATPGRAPRSPIRPFVVLQAQSLGEVERKLHPENGTEELIGGEGMELRVAVQHERDKAAAAGEIHDASDDVYYVLEGTATLTLGGKLETPREVEPGEWRGPRISGGQNFEVKKGDLIIVPRGTPHMRSTVGKDFSMILIKVFADPLPRPATKPTPPAKPQRP